MKILDHFLTIWNKQNIELLPSSDISQITNIFNQLGSPATTDVLHLYSMTGGMSEMDNNSWRLWSLSEILEKNSSFSEYGVIFSDYLIDSCFYRLKMENNYVSSIYVDYRSNEQIPIKIASSLEEFFLNYSMDDDFIIKH